MCSFPVLNSWKKKHIRDVTVRIWIANRDEINWLNPCHCVFTPLTSTKNALWRCSNILVFFFFSLLPKEEREPLRLITRASGNAAPRPLVSGTDRNQLFNYRSADPLLAAADKAHCTRTRRALGSARLSLTRRAAVPHGRGFWPRSPRARQKRRVQSNLILITRVKAIPPTRRDAPRGTTAFPVSFIGCFTWV